MVTLSQDLLSIEPDLCSLFSYSLHALLLLNVFSFSKCWQLFPASLFSAFEMLDGRWMSCVLNSACLLICLVEIEALGTLTMLLKAAPVLYYRASKPCQPHVGLCAGSNKSDVCLFLVGRNGFLQMQGPLNPTVAPTIQTGPASICHYPVPFFSACDSCWHPRYCGSFLDNALH